jgi:hypothetical protein
MMSKYAGAEWLIDMLRYLAPKSEISELGKNVADFLGELFFGIYHLDENALQRVDWANKGFIVISIGWKDWSTVDFNNLTRLVFLAHWLAIRVSMDASKHGYMRLLFHQRAREGSVCERHPTLDEAVEYFKAHVSLAEVGQ